MLTKLLSKSKLPNSNYKKYFYVNKLSLFCILILNLLFSSFINAQTIDKKIKKAKNSSIPQYASRGVNSSFNQNLLAEKPGFQNPNTQAHGNNDSNNQSIMPCNGAYCVPTFTTSVDPITNVTFAGINNTTSNATGGSSLEAFCNTAAVTVGQSYSISIQANTVGAYTYGEIAYFDWNQNNVFGDVANEIYTLGTLYNTNGADGTILTASINVPSGATIGNTRMRVIHRYNSYAAACVTGAGYGQAEDYGVTVSPATSYCQPQSLTDATSLYFEDVEFIGTLNDVSNFGNGNSTTTPVGYQDHTSLTNSIQAQGQGMNVFVESTYRGHIKAWVDWNSDFSFDDATELVFDSGSIATTSTTFGFVVPSAQPVGDYRIRIRTYNSFHYSSGAESYVYDYDACEDFYQNGVYNEYGETEDYTFTVIESCSAVIDTITEASNCGPGPVTLAATGSVGTTSFNWYANESDTTPIATTATGSWTTPSLTNTTDYYVTAVSATCESLVKTKIRATIMSITTLSFTPSVPEVCGEDDIIQLSASAENEVAYLINEDFEGSGIGAFTNNNIVDNGATENAITMWQQRTSTFIPSEQVWFPAVSSGFGTNKFVMATSDTGTSNTTENALESTTLDSSTFTDLTLNFDMYFSRYLFGATPDIPENVNVEVSTNGGTSWTSIQLYDDDVGYGTTFSSISLDLSTYVDETNLKVRIRYYANYWCDGVAIDNVQLFGSRPLSSSFTWTSGTTIDAYLDAAATMPYTPGTTASTVYIKPTTVQLQSNTFSFIATATLSNGCSVSENISINNRTKYWTGSSSTDWNDASNWLPSGIPTSNNCVIIPNQTIISGTNYDAYARNLTIRATGDLELQSNNNLTVTEWVNVNTGGNFDIRDSASLIQIDDVPNSGIVKMDRDTQPIYRYDYTYWGSPMTTASGYTLNDLSPNTLLDKFFSWLPSLANGNGTWIYENPNTTVMTPALGYIVRAPQTYSTDPNTLAVYNAQFQGTPNNGDISTPISTGTDANVGVYIGDTAVTPDDDQWNLIANPYTSAIDIVSFLNETGNSTLLDGTAYVWTHNSPPSASFPDPFYANFSINYTSNDYASINSLGATSVAASGGQVPTQYMAAGQAFFVLGLNNGSAIFNNSMRVNNNNDNFFKNNGENSNQNTEFEKHRLWLNLTNDNGSFSQTLIGYAENATNGWDRGLDANTFGGNGVTFYSVIPDKTLTIQAKPLPFEVSDIVPIGYKATSQGSHRIGIDHFDALFDNQNIYLKDNDLSIIHDLKAAPYIFNSNAGTFNERFEIVYNSQSLSVDEQNSTDNNSIKIITNENLSVVSGTKTIKKIVVFDILGRKLMTYKNLSGTTIDLEGIYKANRALLIQIEFSDNSILFKKALF